MSELIASVLYVFRQSAQYFSETRAVTLAGNIDPLFLIVLFYIYKHLKRKEIPVDLLKILATVLLYASLQIIAIDHIDILRLTINVAKMMVCIGIMFYTIEFYGNFKFVEFSVLASGLYFTLTLFAITFRDTILWTFNDKINKYDLSRLKLFYLEPSELGFHVMILMIFLIGYLMVTRNIKTRIILLICTLTNVFVLYFTRSLGAITIGAFAIGMMLVIDWYRHRTRQKTMIYLAISIFGIIMLSIMVITKSSIIQRIMDTLQGTDQSNWYRVGVSLKVAKQSFLDFNGIGVGFGNMNTPHFALLYKYMGFAQVLVNSTIYFLVEGGIYALGFLVVLYTKLIKAIFKTKSLIKLGLFIFLALYQLVGSHFTNPLIWLLYGLIFSTFDENGHPDLHLEFLGLNQLKQRLFKAK